MSSVLSTRQFFACDGCSHIIKVGKFVTRLCVLFALLSSSIGFAQSSHGNNTEAAGSKATVSYRLSFEGRSQHLLNVRAQFDHISQSEVELFLAVWTPGSYLVREYARHIQKLDIKDLQGKSIPFKKSLKNRWLVQCGEQSQFVVNYQVYCHEMSVRTNWIQEDYSFLNGAPTFISLVGQTEIPHSIQVKLPENWMHCICPLPAHPDGKTHHFRASSYDALVDAPMVLGNPQLEAFHVRGKLHYLVNLGGDKFWDIKKCVTDLKKIIEHQADFWGDLPYPYYYFLNLVLESGGGLEHENSTLMLTSRFSFRDAKRYRSWLSLVCHEFFHAWNVKRLKPEGLLPYNYEKENYTPSLWIAEGITSYYDELMLVRTGLTKPKEYLQILSKTIRDIQNTPGRLVHPLAQCSHDAWIKHYRPDENSSNTTTSYYSKGALVAWLLDMKIREATNGLKSLDDLMRLAYERLQGGDGYSTEDFRMLASEIAGAELDEFFDRSVDQAAELDYSQATQWLGLDFEHMSQDSDTAGADISGSDITGAVNVKKDSPAKAWLGLSLKNDKGRVLIRKVLSDTPAYKQGLNVNDEIIAVDSIRLLSGQWDSRRLQYKAGDSVELLISRRGKLIKIPVLFFAEPRKNYKLKIAEDATTDKKKNLDSWLGQRFALLPQIKTTEPKEGKAKTDAKANAATSQ